MTGGSLPGSSAGRPTPRIHGARTRRPRRDVRRRRRTHLHAFCVQVRARSTPSAFSRRATRSDRHLSPQGGYLPLRRSAVATRVATSSLETSAVCSYWRGRKCEGKEKGAPLRGAPFEIWRVLALEDEPEPELEVPGIVVARGTRDFTRVGIIVPRDANRGIGVAEIDVVEHVD